ncbi:MAG TPA: hypothetical protein VFU89_04440 [Rhabdochlamydiaceae bacterium]|nr:hypothetical protein [Rhabdochlamydiaceae bacterium]
MTTPIKCSTGTAGTTPLTSQQDIKEKLKQMFETTTKVSKVFDVDGARIGITFNPKKEKISFGEDLHLSAPVIAVFNKNTPGKVVQKIREAILEKYTKVGTYEKTISGKLILQFFNWESASPFSG